MVLRVLWRKTGTMDKNNLDQIRKEIDTLDRELSCLLEKRMDLVSMVSDYKRKNNIEVLDSSREARVIENVLSTVNNADYRESIKAVFESIMAESKAYQRKRMKSQSGKRFVLIGKKLSHSISPQIHDLFFKKTNIIGSYELYETEEAELPVLLRKLEDQGFCGANVTIPYKTDIMNYLDSISDIARTIGAVNTIELGGTKRGHNTDYFGFGKALEHCGFDPKNKKCAVLGSGGASRAVISYLEDHGAADILIVSRDPEGVTFKFPGLRSVSLDSFSARGIDVIVNTTPVGMYPEPGRSPLRKDQLVGASFVIDLIYNPMETLLITYARELGIPCDNGLYMLVAQAVSAQEIWQGRKFGDELVIEIYNDIKDVLPYI
jgi:shikimate dehydrogenase